MLKDCKTKYLEYDESGRPVTVDVHLTFVDLTLEEIEWLKSLHDQVLSKASISDGKFVQDRRS